MNTSKYRVSFTDSQIQELKTHLSRVLKASESVAGLLKQAGRESIDPSSINKKLDATRARIASMTEILDALDKAVQEDLQGE
jgi:hypothetical protein